MEVQSTMKVAVPRSSRPASRARPAAISLGNDGIDVFCVGLGSGDDGYLTRIFGRRNFVQIDRVERLPERLPMLYPRLTA
jgi:nitric oxide reductase activation protein